MQASAAVPAYVHNHAFAVVVASEEVAVHAPEAVVVHRCDVHIAEAAAREAVHFGTACVHPALVKQVGERACADGQHHFVHGSTVGCAETYECLASCDVGEQFGVVGVVCKGLAVDGIDDAAGTHFRRSFVEGAAFHDFVHAQARAGEAVVVDESERSGPVGAAACGGAVASAGVAYVQFAEPFAQEFGKVVVVGDVRHEFAVGLGHDRPVHAVHVGGVEAFGLLACDVVEHIGSFGIMVEAFCGRVAHRGEFGAFRVEFADGRAYDEHSAEVGCGVEGRAAAYFLHHLHRAVFIAQGELPEVGAFVGLRCEVKSLAIVGDDEVAQRR